MQICKISRHSNSDFSLFFPTLETLIGSKLITQTMFQASCLEPSLTCVIVKVDSSSHSVDHRLGLLKDLLLHEGTEVACNGKIRKQGNISNFIKR